MDKSTFLSSFPAAYFLDSADATGLTKLLQINKFLANDETIMALSKPGEGNMNLVLRAETKTQTFIVKQSRPWVEKYPSIAAPGDRVKVESAFLQAGTDLKGIAKYHPEILAFYPDHFMLIMEDLGNTTDFMKLYENQAIELLTVQKLGQYLDALHNKEVIEFPSNAGMKELNHQHIFEIPFDSNNGLNLNESLPGLQAVASEIHQNVKLAKVAKVLGEIYLEDGSSLIHGDFYPGSWLLNDQNRLKVIDAEFSFKGYREFDWGVFLAHMFMSRQSASLISKLINICKESHQIEMSLLAGFAGVEVIRRIIGVAQLPLSLNLNERKQLLKQASKWMLNGEVAV